MGALLSLFKPEVVHPINFFLDFSNYQDPQGGDELDVYNAVKNIMDRSDEMLELLTNYTGCDALIKKAINTPGNKEIEEECWDSLLPAVDSLRIMFDHATNISDVAPRLFQPLCQEGSMQTQTALAKLLCDLFNFILSFDDKKMMNPHIQNDFSFFRRSMGKLKAANRNKIPEDVANKMSLFYAYPTPMMNMLTTLVSSQDFAVSKDEVIQGLSLYANVCLDMVEKRKFDDASLNMFCLRAMTAAIVLIDHISDLGVFYRKSPVNIKNAILTLRDKQDELGTGGLLNVLKYSTKHLNDAETPSTIKNLLI